MTRYHRRESSITRPCQGAIYRDVTVLPTIPLNDTDSEDELTVIDYNYAVMLTQECDLERDFYSHQGDPEKHDKFLPSLLLAPAYLAQSLRNGEHLADIGLKMQHINSDRWRVVKRNGNKRYHYLTKDTDFGVPALVIDFKHYFTIPRDNLYRQLVNAEHYVASLDVPFREHLSSRFTHYLSRIGLPE